MITHNLGYPRIGSQRELKKACEQYWSGKISQQELYSVKNRLTVANWKTQQEAGIDLIPTNDFSFYDQVLDTCLMVNAIPQRYSTIVANETATELDLYFAMARGYQKNELDITAMEMTKWFDTNYHYIVPEFSKKQNFSLFSEKVINDFVSAKETLGKTPKVVLLSPISFLLLGKEKEVGFNRIELLAELLPVYEKILEKLVAYKAEWIQFDEPCLVHDLGDKNRLLLKQMYEKLVHTFPQLKFMIATYFDCMSDNLSIVSSLPVAALHIDITRCPAQLNDLLATNFVKNKTILSLGIVDGRNIWKNDFAKSLLTISKVKTVLGENRVFLAPSCSLLHVPYDLALEVKLDTRIKNWMAFAKQKLDEIVSLNLLSSGVVTSELETVLLENKIAIEQRKNASIIHREDVKQRVNAISDKDTMRNNSFAERQKLQKIVFDLPLFPTTTIGSFPQTNEVRELRSKYKKTEIDTNTYNKAIQELTLDAIQRQEKIGVDVLVHGEYERNDMVEYFGELLEGYVFTENGWVQSYGSRCVKPPVIFGDVKRKSPMTVDWAIFAQSQTEKYVKGMLTGPVTMLQWSFVRDDQPREITCLQLALAIRDEVSDLEKAGIRIIQIDEPAFREGLPLKKNDWQKYLNWAVKSFKIASSSVKDDTQIHTHMCYSEFNDIIEHIAAMDADVITIETSRSQMELLDAFVDFNYPNEIGPGIYDIHSPRIPSVNEMTQLLEKASTVLPATNIWVNPDCGLKTRKWNEVEAALTNMVDAAKELRKKYVEVV